MHKCRRALAASGILFIDLNARSDEDGASVRLRLREEALRASDGRPEERQRRCLGIYAMADIQLRQTHRTISDMLSMVLAITILVAFITFELMLNRDRVLEREFVRIVAVD